MDNNKIFEKTKMKIAISNVKEEDIVMDKRKLNIGKGIGIAACITLSMTGVVFATTQIINKFGANSSEGIQTAIENGYYSDINTEYKVHGKNSIPDTGASRQASRGILNRARISEKSLYVKTTITTLSSCQKM